MIILNNAAQLPSPKTPQLSYVLLFNNNGSVAVYKLVLILYSEIHMDWIMWMLDVLKRANDEYIIVNI